MTVAGASDVDSTAPLARRLSLIALQFDDSVILGGKAKLIARVLP